MGSESTVGSVFATLICIGCTPPMPRDDRLALAIGGVDAGVIRYDAEEFATSVVLHRGGPAEPERIASDFARAAHLTTCRPTKSGKTVVEVAVDEQGDVTSARFVGTVAGDERFAECIVRVLADVRGLPPEDSGQTFVCVAVRLDEQ